MTRRRLAVLGLLFAVATPATAQQQGTMTLEFEYLAIGNATTLDDGHVFWVGAFSGAALNREASGPVDRAFATCPGTNELDFNAGTSTFAGFCVLNDGADGRIVVDWHCEGIPGTCSAGTATWRGTAGRWNGLTAEASWTAQLGPAFEDGTIPGYATWTVNYQMP